MHQPKYWISALCFIGFVAAHPAQASLFTRAGVFFVPAVPPYANSQDGTSSASYISSSMDAYYKYTSSANASATDTTLFSSSLATATCQLSACPAASSDFEAFSVAYALGTLFIYTPGGSGSLVFDFSYSVQVQQLNMDAFGGSPYGYVTFFKNSYVQNVNNQSQSLLVQFKNGTPISYDPYVNTTTRFSVPGAPTSGSLQNTASFDLHDIRVLDSAGNQISNYLYREDGISLPFIGGTVTQAPEPGTLGMISLGVLGLFSGRRQRTTER